MRLQISQKNPLTAPVGQVWLPVQKLAAPLAKLTALIKKVPTSQMQADALNGPKRRILSSKASASTVASQFKKMEADLSTRLAGYKTKLAKAKTPEEKKYYSDLVNALTGDLKDLKANKNKGSLQERINSYNRLSHEVHLEVKYNVNLTSKGTAWSAQDLNDLDAQLSQFRDRSFLFKDKKFSEIRLEAMQPGVGGLNYGNGLITMPSGGVEWALLHEVGHNHEDENPKWKQFQALSGWQDVTGQFSDVGPDYIDGTYKPYNGVAKLKSTGQVYKDGSTIDLNGDGTVDGIVQVQQGRVMIHSTSAKFTSAYSHVNPREDFAETFDLFFKNPHQLKQVAPEKFQFMVDFMGFDPTKVVARPIMKI